MEYIYFNFINMVKQKAMKVCRSRQDAAVGSAELEAMCD